MLWVSELYKKTKKQSIWLIIELGVHIMQNVLDCNPIQYSCSCARAGTLCRILTEMVVILLEAQFRKLANYFGTACNIFCSSASSITLSFVKR